jgi:hypothetical protein
VNLDRAALQAVIVAKSGDAAHMDSGDRGTAEVEGDSVRRLAVDGGDHTFSAGHGGYRNSSVTDIGVV